MAPILALCCVLLLLFLGDLRIHAMSTIIILLCWSSVCIFLRKRSGHAQQLWFWAIFLRCVSMFLAPTLSDDVFRYVWEGFWITEGGNPYWISPLESSVEHWSKSMVNHPELTSIYPPLTQWIFALLSFVFDRVGAITGLGTLCDLGILWVLYKQQGASRWVWIYALHPLPILESSSSGHMESWAILPLMASLLYPQARTWLLWLGGMIKILPLALLPIVLRSWKTGLLMFLCTSILMMSFSLWSFPIGAQQYAQHWSFHASIFSLLEIFVHHPRLWVLLMGIGSFLYMWRKVRPFSKQAFWLAGTFVLLSPTVHPWYLLWVFPLAIWHRNRAWVGLCFAYPLWYVALTTWDVHTESWDPPLWPQIFSYGLFLGLLAWEYFLNSKKESDIM